MLREKTKRKKPKIKIMMTLPLFVFIAICWNCPGTVETGKDFAMRLNGREYKVTLETAKGKIQEIESGFSNSYRYTVIFPIKAFSRFGMNGFELAFGPNAINVGEIIESSAGDSNYSFRVTYYPLVGHKVNEGIMLEYSSREKTGSLKVRFDMLEPQINGRVKGKILEAVLYGYYQGADSMETLEPKSPKKLEIYNFVFDTTFERAMF